jgi:PQQ-dependent dehydrogenase (methanol/ethanol family)
MISTMNRRQSKWLALPMLLATTVSAAQSGAATGTMDDLAGLMQSPGNWAAQAGNYANWRYSPLRQITRANVRRLQIAWQMPTHADRGHEGGPLVIGNTLFVHTPYPNRVYAIDLDDLSEKWRYEPKQDEAVLGILCCDTVSRGLAYGNGKVLLQQTDTTLVALDAQTGAVQWQAVNGDPRLGMSATNAPHVFDHYVVTGIAGGEYGVLGYLTAYDLDTGRRVWRGYSAGPDTAMLVDPEKTTTWRDGAVAPVGANSSLSTWQGDQWKIGGGATWGWYAYDPALRLVYYGSGNPSTWNPVQRPGDNRWSMSLWARDIDTGTVRWVYQMTPHDEWDYDGVNEPILFDHTGRDGRERHLLAHFDRNGFAYTLDRETGALLRAEKFDPSVNWATHVDPPSGRPQVRSDYSPAESGEDETTSGICPATIGAKNQAPAALSPKYGVLIVPTIHLCMDYEAFHVDYEQGKPYTGAAITLQPVPGDEKALGRLIAWDPLRGRIRWSKPEPLPLWGGALTTATRLAFYGTLDGYLKARDVRDGRLLWTSARLRSGIVGNVASWMHGGRQFVGVLAGIGGLANDRDGIGGLVGPDALATTPADAGGDAAGGALIAFALTDQPR